MWKTAPGPQTYGDHKETGSLFNEFHEDFAAANHVISVEEAFVECRSLRSIFTVTWC